MKSAGPIILAHGGAGLPYHDCRWNSYYEIVPNAFTPERTDRLTGGSFDSDIRANAIMLNVLLEVEPANKQIPVIIKYLTQNADRMYSTQERSFAFLALGKAASLNADANVSVDILVDGKSINKFSGKDLTVADNRLNASNTTMKASGKGEVYYFWSAEGVKLNEKVKEEDSYMQIRRTFYSYKTGRLIPDFRFYQGELIVCKIELTGFDRNAETIVITDLIPVGFEIENPRLNPATELKWIPKNPMKLKHRHERRVEEIESIQVETFWEVTRLANDQPSNTIAAQFSIQFALAVALLYDRIGPAEVSDAHLHDPAILSLARMVRVAVDDMLDREFPAKTMARVTMHTRRGDLRTTVEFPRGNPENPMSPAEREAKFQLLTRDLISDERSQRLQAAIRGLPEA